MNELTVNQLEKQRTPIEIALEVDRDNMVSVKHLYNWLEFDPTHYARWCQDNLINNSSLDEGIDFWSFSHDGENLQGGRPTTDYKITLDLAKDIAMGAKSEKGKIARRYFIRIEKALVVTIEQYNELVAQYNEVKDTLIATNDNIKQLTARVDLLDEGKVLMDTRKAEFIYEATEDLKEMMSDFGYSGEKYGQMLTDVLNKMEEMTHVPFSFYRDNYMQQKGLNKIENRLEVIAEYEELQYEFYSAIKQLYNKHDNPFEFGNVISEEELMDGVF